MKSIIIKSITNTFVIANIFGYNLSLKEYYSKRIEEAKSKVHFESDKISSNESYTEFLSTTFFIL